MKTILALDGTYLKVSDCDWLFLAGYNWANRKGYYRCTANDIFNGYKTNSRHMHWFVSQLMGLKVPEGYTIDHIDRDKTNNQRSNLRIASYKLQAQNTIMPIGKSGITGVYFVKDSKINPWAAKMSDHVGKYIHIGVYPTKEEASEAYQTAKKIRDDKEIELCKRQ